MVTGPYSKVVRSVWGDAKFSRLSPMRPSAQALWLYLLTGPHCRAIPGVIPTIGIGTIADRLKWPPAAVLRSWREIETAGMAFADWDAGVIWLPNAILYNDPQTPNVILSWRSVVLPQCELVTRALCSLRDHMVAKQNEIWVNTLEKVFAKDFPEVFRKATPDPFPKGTPDPFGDPRSGSGSVSKIPPYPPLARGEKAFGSCEKIARKPSSFGSSRARVARTIPPAKTIRSASR